MGFVRYILSFVLAVGLSGSYATELMLEFTPIGLSPCPQPSLYEDDYCVKISTSSTSKIEYVAFRNKESASAGLAVLTSASKSGYLLRNHRLNQQVYLPALKFYNKDLSSGEISLGIVSELQRRCEEEQNIGEYLLGIFSEKYNCVEQAYIVSTGRSYTESGSVPIRYGQSPTMNVR